MFWVVAIAASAYLIFGVSTGKPQKKDFFFQNQIKYFIKEMFMWTFINFCLFTKLALQCLTKLNTLIFSMTIREDKKVKGGGDNLTEPLRKKYSFSMI